MSNDGNFNRVQCPVCKRKRLFNADVSTTGRIEIKCAQCKNVLSIVFDKGKITYMN